jgi:hypothetical protein
MTLGFESSDNMRIWSPSVLTHARIITQQENAVHMHARIYFVPNALCAVRECELSFHEHFPLSCERLLIAMADIKLQRSGTTILQLISIERVSIKCSHGNL